MVDVESFQYPANIKNQNINNKNTRKMCEICSKLTKKNTRTTSITLRFRKLYGEIFQELLGYRMGNSQGVIFI